MAVTTNEGERIQQAERDVSELRGAYQHLATKADVEGTKVEIAETRTGLKAEIAETRTGLKAEIAETRAELKANIAETRTELKTDIAEMRAELKADIAEVRGELRLMNWVMGLTLAAVVYPLLERIWT
jgi:chromosome segregation ATPase